MFERAVDYYRKLNAPRPPEESRGFRAAVMASVIVSVLAAVRYAEMNAISASLVVCGIVIGFVFSYYRRRNRNLLLKFILTLALIGVFIFFWTEVPGSLHDLRYPLIRLFLWLQVLHSFDVPSRRDLDFSLVCATILIAFGGSLSFTMDFLVYLTVFFFAATLALYLGHLSSLRSRADSAVPGPRLGPGRMWLVSTLLVLLLTLGFFVLLPRLPGLQFYTPLSTIGSLFTQFTGDVLNPAYPMLPEDFPAEPLPFAPGSYFNQYLDLRVRGVPGDDVVMRVRSQQEDYWRCLAFDRFLGNGWDMRDEDAEIILTDKLPFFIPDKTQHFYSHGVVQTFIVEKEQPNTIFCAYKPEEVYYPSQALRIDENLGLRTPGPMEKGMVYTVVSQISDASPEQLRYAAGTLPSDYKNRYLQLPDDVPDRVGELAASICSGETNQYDMVVAIRDYLREEYEYRLVPGRQGNAQNSVDFFLFEEQRGNCEHFASAMVVLCREAGIPARLAVGYSAGEYNPFTGYFDVTEQDAHAWPEVLFPSYGWIGFEPTPAFEGYPPGRGGSDLWSGFKLFSYLGKKLSKLVPVGALKTIGRAFAWVGKKTGRAFLAAARTVAQSWRGILAAIVILIGILFLLLFYLRMGREKSRGGPPPDISGVEQAVGLFNRMSVALSAAGCPRAPPVTPLEYARQVQRVLDLPGVQGVVDWFDRVRYGGAETGKEEVQEIEDLISEIEKALVRKKHHRGIG